MRTPTIIAAVIVAASCSDLAGAYQDSRGPWELRTIAAAGAAGARLGQNRSRSLQSIVVSIPALIGSADNQAPSLWATVQKLARAVDELSAVETSRAVQIDRLRRNAVRVRPR